jgi:hypothetical protein
MEDSIFRTVLNKKELSTVGRILENMHHRNFGPGTFKTTPVSWFAYVYHIFFGQWSQLALAISTPLIAVSSFEK